MVDIVKTCGHCAFWLVDFSLLANGYQVQRKLVAGCLHITSAAFLVVGGVLLCNCTVEAVADSARVLSTVHGIC